MFLSRNLLLLLALVPLILWVEASGLDVQLSSWFFDAGAQTFPWRRTGWFVALAHEGMRLLLIVFEVGVVGALLLSLLSPATLESTLPPYWRQSRVLFYLALAMLLGPVIVSLLKQSTTHACPWNLSMFGGEVTYHMLGDGPLFSLTAPGRCFPAGHPSGGFALLAFVPLLRGRARHLMLLTGLGVGMLMGWSQIMRGAHFLSHVLWSGWVCWLAIVLVFAALRPPIDSPIEGTTVNKAGHGPASGRAGN